MSEAEYVYEDEDGRIFDEDGAELDPKDYADGDHELRDEIAALRAEVAEEHDVAAINRAIDDLQREHGVRLSAAQVQELGGLIDDGYNPGEAFSALELDRDHDFEADFATTVERVEREQGRTLLEAETDRLWRSALDHDDPTHTEGVELVDLDAGSGQRSDYIAQRITDMDATDDKPPGGTVNDNTGVVEYDLDNSSRDRADYMAARAAGHEPAAEGD